METGCQGGFHKREIKKKNKNKEIKKYNTLWKKYNHKKLIEIWLYKRYIKYIL